MQKSWIHCIQNEEVVCYNLNIYPIPKIEILEKFPLTPVLSLQISRNTLSSGIFALQ